MKNTSFHSGGMLRGAVLFAIKVPHKTILALILVMLLPGCQTLSRNMRLALLRSAGDTGTTAILDRAELARTELAGELAALRAALEGDVSRAFFASQVSAAVGRHRQLAATILAALPPLSEKLRPRDKERIRHILIGAEQALECYVAELE